MHKYDAKIKIRSLLNDTIRYMIIDGKYDRIYKI